MSHEFYMDSHHIPQATCSNRSDKEHILHEKDMLWLDIHTKQLSPSFQHHTGRHAQLMLWFHVPWHGAMCLRRVAFRGGSRKPVDKGFLFVFNGEGSSFWHFWEASPLPPKEQHFLKSRCLLLLSWETVCEVERKRHSTELTMGLPGWEHITGRD